MRERCVLVWLLRSVRSGRSGFWDLAYCEKYHSDFRDGLVAEETGIWFMKGS
jgi:hypothetical protein